MEELKSENLFEKWDLKQNISKVEKGELEGGAWLRGGVPKRWPCIEGFFL